MSAVCKCDICGQDMCVERIVHWRNVRKYMAPLTDIDVCVSCEARAHSIAMEEEDRCRKEASERTAARLKALIP